MRVLRSLQIGVVLILAIGAFLFFGGYLDKFSEAMMPSVGVYDEEGGVRRVGILDLIRDPAEAMGLNPKEVVRGGIRQIPGSFGFDQEGKKNELLFQPDDLNVTRTLVITHTVPFRVFLKNGEAMPQPSMKPLYVEARAGQFLSQFCEDALATIAKKCAFMSAEVTPKKNGYYRLEGRFAYTPSFDMGAFKDESGYEALSVVVGLPKRKRGERAVENTSLERRKAFQRALDACSQLRKAYRNCVVERIYIDMAYFVPKPTVAKKTTAKKPGREKKKNSVFDRKVGNFTSGGSSSGFGKKAGFKNKKPGAIGKDKNKQSAAVIPFSQTMSARAVVAVYALDSRAEQRALDKLGDVIEGAN